ncbi:uncharacterized protein EV422DRAFT_73879 [Fimicolochytrium jonesii]|uniref:uncharacterized protein n=1 Tax=Fimicolochytrium jonesii TaxID=1396493 RepID=UPI0022FED41E|nr:uncharacterized protein EV422DRAFT_73879 [Fimicolochytrium jonesii]KAI8820517.1 hypothetical protein EV422DRAFT_73879 [Fimicolochytrium jonesii]
MSISPRALSDPTSPIPDVAHANNTDGGSEQQGAYGGVDRRGSQDSSIDSDRPASLAANAEGRRSARNKPVMDTVTRAKKYWERLRAHVRRGFFHSLLNTRTGATSDFLSLVDRLWTLVHQARPRSSIGPRQQQQQQQASQHKGQNQQPDSTTEFVMAGWARIKAEQHALERQRARAIDAGVGGLPDTRVLQNRRGGGRVHSAGGTGGENAEHGFDGEMEDDREESGGVTIGGLLGGGGEEVTGDDDGMRGGSGAYTSARTRGYGLEGLSLDTVPNANVTKELMQISKGLHVQPLDEADFYTVQVHFNRGWKLLLLGLGQQESLARYMAMAALRRAIPVINDTLLDSTTRESLIRVLINLMVSDERSENRLKAVYLLGQLGFYLGTVREHDDLLMTAFKELTKKLLSIQYEEKRDPARGASRFTARNRELKIYLLNAIGKFTQCAHKQSRIVEDLLVYMLHEEFERGESATDLRKLDPQSTAAQSTTTASSRKAKSFPALHVVRALLSTLNNEMKRTDSNQKYIGAIFKKYVHPLMRSNHQTLQTMAVQFISNWLPIMNDDASLLGIETLISGLEHTKNLHVPNFSRTQYDAEYKALKMRTRIEESRMAMRSKLLRQLLLVPGNFAKLVPVPGHLGFFVEVNSSMMYTKGIVVNLPIHPKSSVTLSRPLPNIPGVPPAVTTIPPVFMDPLWAERQKAPEHRYEYMERAGEVPGVPYGYTYSPAPLVDVTELLKGDNPESKGILRTDGAQRLVEGSAGRAETFSKAGGESEEALPSKGPQRSSVRANPSLDNNKKPAIPPGRQTGSARRPLSSSRPRRPSAVDALRGASSPSEDRVALRRDSSTQSLARQRPLARRKRRDEIPPGTARIPQKSDTMPSDSRRILPGFLNICPFPGYDPDRVDRAAVPVSAIYGKQTGLNRAQVTGNTVSAPIKTKSAGETRQGADVPEGFTTDRHPVLWPSRIQNLRSARYPTDFPINAPVLFDIIQPGSTHLQRVMTRVASINKEMAAVSVQRGSDEDESLSTGATFNIFIRTRQSPNEWITVNLEVVDDDFQDDISFGKPKSLLQSSPSSMQSLVNIRSDKSSQDGELRSSAVRKTSGVPGPNSQAPQPTVVFPIPSGFTTQGEPYFAPPINMTPFPVGYTAFGVPYFGRTSSIKPIPMGMTTMGTRFYSVDGKASTDQGSRNHLAGYDNVGQPFFIPRGCTVPPPAGFTNDGIAYYDIPSLMHHRGVMVIPPPATVRAAWPSFEEDDDEEWDEGSGSVSHIESQLSLTRSARGTARRRPPKPMDQAQMTAQLVENLEEAQPQLKQNFLKGHKRAVGTIRRVAEFRRLNGFDEGEEDLGDVTMEDPEDIVGFLRDSDDLAYLRANAIRVQIEPGNLEFQSVHAPVSKAAVLRYRAGRGDYGERDFFLSVEPVDVFAVKMFHLKLQGEGVMEISLTYYPDAMKIDQVEGSLNLIDDTGKKMASCSLVAFRKSFLKVNPVSVDAGWTLPDRRKEVLLTMENISSSPAIVAIQLESELQNVSSNNGEAYGTQSSTPRKDEHGSKRQSDRDTSAFVLPVRQVKLQPHESKNIPVYFEPTKLGHFADVVEINGPGGDLIHVKIAGIAGIPIAVYPENEENSRAGAAELTRERCNFMRKFRRPDPRSGEKAHVALTADDTAILKNMMSATSDQDSRKEAHTMDFGICPSEPHCRLRCLTLMNLADTPVTVGLYPHHSAIKCPYLVRIAPRMANTVEVRFEKEESSTLSGNILTAIEVICPEFQNIPLNIRAFVGQPIFCPIWEYAFFKPCRIGAEEHLTLNFINVSQYELQFHVDGLRVAGEDVSERSDGESSIMESCIRTTLSTKFNEPTTIPAFSMIPATFTFSAKQRGPLLQLVELCIVKPFKLKTMAAIMEKSLHLIGICIEPYLHRPGGIPDKNSVDFLRMWMSHPKRLLDEYPSSAERAQRFDLGPIAKPYTPGARPELTFAKELVMFRPDLSRPNTSVADANIRRSHVQPILIQNTGSQNRNVVFFASTGFSVDPRAKSMQPADVDNVDVIFLPPVDISESATTFGFAAALTDHDHTFHAIQTVGKPLHDILVFPQPSKDGNAVILDFGRVEMTVQALDINLKYILLCNTYLTSYSWNVKFVGTKQKFSAFDASMMMGEIQTMESFAIPFRFHCDTSGTFETTAEIYVKEAVDRFAKPVKLVNVILRGQNVATSMTGLPDTLDFGSTVVYQKKKRKIIISNNGSTEAPVTILSRPPFDISPKSFYLPPKGNQEIVVTYSPTESRTSQIKVLAFSNHKLYLVLLTGTGGTAELICEKYETKDVDFGFQREGTVGYLSLHLTNKGTLPLTLKAVTADNLDLVKLDYLTITSTVPYEVNSGQRAGRNAIVVKRDFWSILRRKFSVFSVLKQLLSGSTGVRKVKDKNRRNEGPSEEEGKSIRIQRTGKLNLLDHASLLQLPQLRPFYSYHFRLGYTSRYQARKDTDLVFHYMPITTDEDPESLSALYKNMSVHVIGGVYRTLELYPPYHDFGLAPAEAYIAPDTRKMEHRELLDSYGVMREGQKDGVALLQLEVLNMSMEAQNLTLQSINPEFTIKGRTWTLQAGEKIYIPVEFHPPKEQVQYHGEARFLHNYGTSIVRLSGTGASADLSTEEAVDFGSLKVGSIGSKTLHLHNRGLLACKYFLEIAQTGQDFTLLSEDPFDHEGLIDSGGLESLEIECNCERIIETSAQVIIRWLRNPIGAWEEIVIPLLVQVGMPVFRLQNTELDFHTTYINVNKALKFVVTNDGNAMCNWEASSETPSLTMDPEGGTLQPGETLILEVTFTPQDYESLHHSITFFTDVGSKILMCYGIVGVPYLQISEDDMFIDFGIVCINKTHTHGMVLNNTGKRHIEFEINLTMVTKDGTIMSNDDFDVFFINPTHEIIEPGGSLVVDMQTMPREYNAIYAGHWMIRTRDGEQYRGRLMATGGKAIIKLAPPSLATDETSIKKPKTAEMSSTAGRLTSAEEAHFLPSVIEATRLNLQSHLDNLQEVLAGLRSAEMDQSMLADLAKTQQRMPMPPNAEAQLSRSRPSTGRRPPSSARDVQLVAVGDQKQHGLRVMDGSDVRPQLQSRGRQTPSEMLSRETTPKVPTTPSSGDADLSAAVQYMDELSQLENEIDLAIGLHDLNATPKSAQGRDKAGSPGLGKYQPGSGRKRREKRTREAAVRDFLSSRDGRVSTTESRPNTQLQEEKASLAGATGALRELEAPIEVLIQQAQAAMPDDDAVSDPALQQTLLTAASDRILESTRAVMKAVREQLASPWIGNRDFLTGALRRLQETTHLMETLVEVPEQATTGENDFNMGLLRAGEPSAPILLFNLPNVGNLGFDYKIQKKEGGALLPPGFESGGADLFTLTPPAGEIAPRESVNISATFQGDVPGLYQQAYELISGGEVVLTFTATAKIGAPRLVLSGNAIDFGLIARQCATSQTLTIDNVGSYKDSFRIEAAIPEGGRPVSRASIDSLPFVLSAYKGDVDIGEKFPLQVTFTAPQEGAYSQVFNVFWSKDPLSLECKGIGGGYRIKPTFAEEADKLFNGLDWGMCVVGVVYEKMFSLTNLGNVEGNVNLAHSSDCFRFDVERNSSGEIVVAPQAAVPVKIVFWPSRSETIKEGVQIRLPDGNVSVIALKAISGVTDWKVDGALSFTNMPIREKQTGTLTVTNIGDLDIPLDILLEPDDSDAPITMNILDWQVGQPLSPHLPVTVNIIAAPLKASVVSGTLTLITNLGKEPIQKKHEFSFRAYEEQLMIESESDASVGRIMVGETASVKRGLTNFGSTPVRYRVRLEAVAVPDDPETGPTLGEGETDAVDSTRKPSRRKKKPKTPQSGEKGTTLTQLASSWKLLGATEGELVADGTAHLEAVFECTEDDDDWQEARMIVEKYTTDAPGNWVEVSSFRVVGASGNPKLVILPSELDFKDTGLGARKTMNVQLSNEGSATVNYEVLPNWDWEGIISIPEDFPRQGRIEADQIQSLPVSFRPDQLVPYVANLQIRTQAETKTLVVKGQGAEYKIYDAEFPEVLDFGIVYIGSFEERKVVPATFGGLRRPYFLMRDSVHVKVPHLERLRLSSASKCQNVHRPPDPQSTRARNRHRRSRNAANASFGGKYRRITKVRTVRG